MARWEHNAKDRLRRETRVSVTVMSCRVHHIHFSGLPVTRPLIFREFLQIGFVPPSSSSLTFRFETTSLIRVSRVRRLAVTMANDIAP